MVQFSPDEAFWRGFLIDKDSKSVEKLFDGQMTQKNEDHETVEEAWYKSKTIVTSNGDDFIHYIDSFQRRENRKDCRGLWGLIIIPNKELVRERVIPPILRSGIRIPSGFLKWPAFGYFSLCLNIHADGTLKVRRFARCSHCERSFPISTAALRDWYQQLPLIGKKAQPQASVPAPGSAFSR